MKPSDLKTRIFLDSEDPAETWAVLSSLGFWTANHKSFTYCKTLILRVKIHQEGIA